MQFVLHRLGTVRVLTPQRIEIARQTYWVASHVAKRCGDERADSHFAYEGQRREHNRRIYHNESYTM
jgi:hypothetical protein